jgi:glycosyltransferase involved in cell wall biosynthesis
MATSIARVAVVVPARDEERPLAGSLDAIARAAARVRVPVTVVVALDRCRDATADVVATRPEVVAVRCEAGAVGRARGAGVGRALDRLRAHPRERTWLACTDADSRVPEDWLSHQLALADDGVDLVLGTVDLHGDSPGAGAVRWRREYSRLVGPTTHGHVHGANLGVRASTYLAAGGFAPVCAHEDLLLTRAVTRLPDAVVVPTVAVPVATSDRRLGRAPVGVAADLRHLDVQVAGWESTA